MSISFEMKRTKISTTSNESMSRYFTCQSGQKISWTSVCDGSQQCIDGSDEQRCDCQGDIYPCLQGNNVSCRVACATYGRVTCLTYQNTRACEQYLRMHGDRVNVETAVLSTTPFDALRYSAVLAIGILLFASLFSMMIYLVRRNPSSACAKKPFHMHRKSPSRLTAILQQQEHPSSFTLSRSHYTPAPDCHNLFSSVHLSEQYLTSREECYEPPPYPGPPLSSAVPHSNSIYYETIKTSTAANSMSMLNAVPLPDASTSVYARTHCV